MRRCLRYVAIVVLIGPLLIAWSAARGQDKAPAGLSATDRKLLDGLFKQFLFDPTGAQRVEASITHKPAGAPPWVERRLGWHVAAKGRVFFADGASIAVPPADAMVIVDFVAACKSRIAEKIDPETAWLKDTADYDLVVAAWLRRLGHDELAARMLARARDVKDLSDENPSDEDIVSTVRDGLAKKAYEALAFGFVRREDAEAVADGERLFKLYATEAADRYADAKTIIADLHRRKTKGTFGKQRINLPARFGEWDKDRKVEHLIDGLEEVDGSYWDTTKKDPCIVALMDLGEPIVPRLIDVIEKDRRLTHRMVIYPSSEVGYGISICSVADTARQVISGILRTEEFDPVGGPQDVDAIRAYLKKYGPLPFPERMMTTLMNPQARWQAWHEAARNLSHLNAKPGAAYASGSPWFHRPIGPFAALDKFKEPTAADAILAAMDRESAAILEELKGKNPGYHVRQYEEVYLGALVELNDRRIAPILAQRSGAAKTARQQRDYAEAAYRLGERKPFEEFIEACRLGTIKLPQDDERDWQFIKPGDQVGLAELTDIVATLIASELPNSEKVLDALTDPKHPWHSLAVTGIVHGDRYWNAWLSHPICLPVLREALDDTTDTDTVYRIAKNQLVRETPGISGWEALPELLKGRVPIAEAKERQCDVAATQLNAIVIGLPQHHCLLKDGNRNLAAIRKLMDQFQGRFRKAVPIEVKMFDESGEAPFMVVPNFPILDRPATAADVKAGRAVFHLGGKGKLAGKKLPLIGQLKASSKDKPGERVLIVQAEATADGDVTYGVIARYSIRAIPASAFARVAVPDASEWDEKE